MAAALVFAPAALAEESEADIAREDRIAELEAKVALLADELASVRDQVVVPTDPELVSEYGLGPAASKIYGVERGLSIGGYGEAFYRNIVSDAGNGTDRERDQTDYLRAVLYLGYKFSENIIFNSEIEFEHAGTSGGGSASVELAQLDFFWKPEINFRAGLLLLPMGFINEVHEPNTFFGVQRPLTDNRIIPTTWRENGVGIFGQIGETLEYRSYVVNGFDATGFSDAGVRGGRQNGSRALAESLAWVGRLDWTPEPGLLLGGSVYVGNSGQSLQVNGNTLPSALLTFGELHAQYENGPFWFRGVFAMSHLDEAGTLNRLLSRPSDAPIANLMMGSYVEVAYDVWPLLFGEASKYLAPFFRVEYVDTQLRTPSGFDSNEENETWLFTPGLQFKPIPNVVLKAEYRNFQPRGGQIADEFSIGMGYAF
jgi:opacity protein-like surface antigen